MKRLIPIILLALIAQAPIQAQSYYKKGWQRSGQITPYAALTSFRSLKGWKQGVELGFNTHKGLQVGLFSYHGTASSERSRPSYQGMIVSLPLINLGEFRLSGDGRLGIHDKRFFSFLPTLRASHKLGKIARVSAGVGVSDRLPVFDFKMTFHLKRKTNARFYN